MPRRGIEPATAVAPNQQKSPTAVRRRALTASGERTAGRQKRSDTKTIDAGQASVVRHISSDIRKTVLLSCHGNLPIRKPRLPDGLWLAQSPARIHLRFPLSFQILWCQAGFVGSRCWHTIAFFGFALATADVTLERLVPLHIAKRKYSDRGRFFIENRSRLVCLRQSETRQTEESSPSCVRSNHLARALWKSGRYGTRTSDP